MLLPGGGHMMLRSGGSSPSPRKGSDMVRSEKSERTKNKSLRKNQQGQELDIKINLNLKGISCSSVIGVWL
jgi:hypothetical protein